MTHKGVGLLAAVHTIPVLAIPARLTAVIYFLEDDPGPDGRRPAAFAMRVIPAKNAQKKPERAFSADC